MSEDGSLAIDLSYLRGLTRLPPHEGATVLVLAADPPLSLGEPCPSCGTVHRKWTALARCLYPRTRQVWEHHEVGPGPWLAVHQVRMPHERNDCPDLTVCPTPEHAEQLLARNHRQGPCCGSCARSMRTSTHETLSVVPMGARIFGASPLKAWREAG